MNIITRIHQNDINSIQRRERRRIQNLQRDIAIMEDQPATRRQVAIYSIAIVITHVAFLVLYLAVA